MNSDDSIWARVRGVLVEVFGDDSLVLEPSTTAADVEGWDSASNIVVLVALEEEFGIRFNTGEMATLANVGQLVALITNRMGRPNASTPFTPD